MPLDYPIANVPTDALDSIVEWVIRRTRDLQRQDISRKDIMVLMPRFLLRVLFEWQRMSINDGTWRSPERLGTDGEPIFVINGFDVDFNSPTHDAYVMFRDWSMYPGKQLRYVLPLFFPRKIA